MNKKSIKVGWSSFFIILFYLSISDFFGMFDASVFLPGELYDYVYIMLLCVAIAIGMQYQLRFKWTQGKIVIWPYVFLAFLASIQMFVLFNQGNQGFGKSISVIMELLFIFVVYAFLQLHINVKKMVRCIVMLDVIAAIVYAVEMFHGGPLFSREVHANGLYETLGSFSVWRCWVDSPSFNLFTLSYLFVSIQKKESLFKTQKHDIFAFGVIFVGTLLKLGRTELFAVLVSVVLTYFYADRISAGRLLKKTLKVLLVLIMGVVAFYFIAHGMFMRIVNGVIAIMYITDNSYSSTLFVRTNTWNVRFQYLMEHGKIAFGLGPYSYDSNLIIDVTDVYGTNRGVVSPDSGYATLLTRYGVTGMILYLYGHLRNYVLLRKENSTVCIATASMLIGMLLLSFCGQFAMGNQALLKVGLLFALCVKDINERRSLVTS